VHKCRSCLAYGILRRRHRDRHAILDVPAHTAPIDYLSRAGRQSFSLAEPLLPVTFTAAVHEAHPAGLMGMRTGLFQALPAESQQAQAARATNASTIAVDRVASRRCFFQFRPLRSGSEM
jgi:hypothetical protein